jgi:hypothetical protein
MKTNKHVLSHLAQCFLQWEVFQTKVVQKIKTHFVFSNFFPPETRAVYEIMLKNTVQPDRPQMTIWCMRIACWVPKATNTHSEYVILIAFPLQQWLHKRASLLRSSTLSVLLIFCVVFRPVPVYSVYISRYFVSDRHLLAFTNLAECRFGFWSWVCRPVSGF